MPRPVYYRITTKFVLWFLFVALIPLVIATYVSYNSSRTALEKEAANSLLAVADNKANQIGTYLDEKRKNVTTLAHMSDTVSAMERFVEAFTNTGGVDSLEYLAVDEEFRAFLMYYQKSFGYESLYLISPNSDIVFSADRKRDSMSLDGTALARDSALLNVFRKARETLKTEISDFEYSQKIKAPVVFIAAPVFKGPELLGIVVLGMDNQGIKELVHDYSGLGKTGEMIVACEIDNTAVVITPLRFDPDAEFTRKVRLGSENELDVQRAVRGEQGLGISTDYRGEEVLTVWKFLPSFRLGLVVKIDTKEVYSSADELRDMLLKISAALLALVIIMAIIIAHSISSPIKELTKVSGVITGGDLSARANIEAGDEIGDLAKSFNHMTDSLVEAKAHVEEKKTEVESQKKLLEKANKELDSFVYTASHDLRAPLRGIASFASFLEEDYKDKLDQEGLGHIKEIRGGANRMSKLIEDLLTLSRISRIKNPYEEVSTGDLVDDVVKQLEFDIRDKKVDLKVQEKMPTVYCDRIKIGAVFLNLTNNAIKFSSKGNRQSPKVEIGYSEQGEFHKFFVKDNGIGIDPQYHQQIFGIFKRLHSADEYDGTGAGLSIVKRVIDDHDGKIWVESEVGKGATFCFTIPKALKTKNKA